MYRERMSCSVRSFLVGMFVEIQYLMPKMFKIYNRCSQFFLKKTLFYLYINNRIECKYCHFEVNFFH